MKRQTARTLLLAAGIILTLMVPAAATAGSAPTVEVATMPSLAGLRFELDGKVYVTDRRGRTVVPGIEGHHYSGRQLRFALARRIRLLAAPAPHGGEYRLERWYGGGDRPLTAAIDLYQRVRFRFEDRTGRPIDLSLVDELVTKRIDGAMITLLPKRLAEPVLLQASRVVPLNGALVSKDLLYRVQRVGIGGTNAVNRAQQAFLPAETRTSTVRLLFYSTRFQARDALFGFPIGGGIRLQYPDGHVEEHPFGPDGELVLPALARGEYRVGVDAPGFVPVTPISITRDQVATLKVLSYLDVAVLTLGTAILALGLLLARRPRLRRRLFSLELSAGTRRLLFPGAALALVACAFWTAEARAAAPSPTAEPIPTLAYYYIWFNPSSWRRAKRDLPVLGRYSSDERMVMRRHVRWAKTAGIGGFIVSWKSTPALDRRLKRLSAIAEREHFKLALIYQGLDFERRPLAPERVAADLERFAAGVGRQPAFRLFPKPLVIWSGTWRFSRADVASVAWRLRPKVLLLASEKDVEGYERLAPHVDGNAYYWSSVDPLTHPGYPDKLVAMGRAVHARHGLWIAPAAPGFDARLLGGRRTVPRRAGETLRRELNGALASSPDAVGLISWNEFSENTHIEPSRAFGSRSLGVLADLLGARSPSIEEFDSDRAVATGPAYGRSLLLGFGVIIAGIVGIGFIRRSSAAKRPQE